MDFRVELQVLVCGKEVGSLTRPFSLGSVEEGIKVLKDKVRRNEENNIHLQNLEIKAQLHDVAKNSVLYSIHIVSAGA